MFAVTLVEYEGPVLYAKMVKSLPSSWTCGPWCTAARACHSVPESKRAWTSGDQALKMVCAALGLSRKRDSPSLESGALITARANDPAVTKRGFSWQLPSFIRGTFGDVNAEATRRDHSELFFARNQILASYQQLISSAKGDPVH